MLNRVKSTSKRGFQKILVSALIGCKIAALARPNGFVRSLSSSSRNNSTPPTTAIPKVISDRSPSSESAGEYSRHSKQLLCTPKNRTGRVCEIGCLRRRTLRPSTSACPHHKSTHNTNTMRRLLVLNTWRNLKQASNKEQHYVLRLMRL